MDAIGRIITFVEENTLKFTDWLFSQNRGDVKGEMTENLYQGESSIQRSQLEINFYGSALGAREARILVSQLAMENSVYSTR